MRILLTLLVASICSMAFANSGYEYVQELQSVYASRAIYVSSDNSVVVLGNADNILEFQYMYAVITKLDPLGNILWRIWFDAFPYQYVSITGVDIDAEDKVTFITTLFGGSCIQLWTVDSAGMVTSLSDPVEIPIGVITFNKALRTSNNEIVAVGKAAQNYDVSSACFFRFSSAGDTLATAFWPVDQGSQYYDAEAHDLALMDNGNVLLTCSLYTGKATILEINPDGTIVNRTNLPGNDYFNVFSICKEADNPSYIVAYRVIGYPNMNIHIDRFEDGLFEPLFCISDSVLSDVHSIILGENCIYICGLHSTEGSLIKLSLNGEVNWAWNYQGDNFCPYIWAGFGSPSTALLGLDSDGCIYWAWGERGNQVVIKLLPNGQLPIEDDVAPPPVNQISAYPNPMKDQLSIKLTQDDGAVCGDTRIGIFNIKGQLVRSLQFSKGETEWDGKDKQGKNCPKGIYLIRNQYGSSQTTKICKTR
jgi:hypothetical protein